MNTDIQFRLKVTLRNRFKSAVLKEYKNSSVLSLLGCDIQYLKKFLESKFKDGMSWDNYGKWHIDHIIPCSLFDLSNFEQQKICFHYSNLQPLWAKDNLLKSNKIIGINNG